MGEHQDINIALLQQLAQVQGQLVALTSMVHSQGEATNLRIEDFRRSTETRFSGVEERLTTLEKNERSTALKTAGVAAISAALVSAGFAVMRLPPR